jgi:hypothetical protein
MNLPEKRPVSNSDPKNQPSPYDDALSEPGFVYSLIADGPN